MKNKRFEYYDYGREGNRKIYNQETPPPIPLENVTGFPIALFAGTEDKLAAIEDVRWLKEKLETQDSLIYYEEYKFGHLAFLIPNNLQIYQDIVNLLKTFNPIYVPQSQGVQ